ncbi:MAG TPA: putative inorganic carbon transporter subunit DabA, partial [Jatrophihabitans sp.]|nr:putative inorganic carbon transporter subunit DabA [Jatrophihabitans sp.]
QLAERAVHIPADTVFVAAEHDTATDRVTILDAEAVPASHASDLDRLQCDLAEAGRALAEERGADLPGTADQPGRRAADWAQVRPEWGLARHAAFIIGAGSTVRGLDLGRRTFLHSYDWHVDHDSRVLETILTAPGLVVQWINAQYYFSCVAPGVLGAGDKTLHNVVSDIGVLQGHAGDLRLGLPWQSVAVGDRLYHEPMRALFLVEAPCQRIDSLIAGNELLQQYVDGSWIALAARAGADQPWQLRRPGGGWHRWQAAS